MSANHDAHTVIAIPGTRAAVPVRAADAFLPPELWSLVIEKVDDYCWAWFVLRRVSPVLRSITEDVFARYILHNCSIRFTGEYVRQLLTDLWDWNEYGGGDSGGDIGYWQWEGVSPLQKQFATFCFQPFSFSPHDTKDKVLLKLRDQDIDYKADRADYFVRGDWTGNHTYTQTFYLRRQCCTCPTRIETTEEVARCDCLANIFFDPDTAADLRRLMSDPHFVLLNDQLKSFRLPSIAVHERAQVISLDWRRLCQKYYFDELQCRRAEQPWLRYVMVDPASDEVKVHSDGESECSGIFASWSKEHLMEVIRADGWLYWDQKPTNFYHSSRSKE